MSSRANALPDGKVLRRPVTRTKGSEPGIAALGEVPDNGITDGRERAVRPEVRDRPNRYTIRHGRGRRKGAQRPSTGQRFGHIHGGDQHYGSV